MALDETMRDQEANNELDEGRLGAVAGGIGDWSPGKAWVCPKCGGTSCIEVYQPDPYKLYCSKYQRTFSRV